ncbi:glutamate transport system permease protein [Crossiella equi]|uniref:Glutamate transport system permease protein n=1 Tax=Crossiella equi TaxID=130796 RepID=A0ABS5ABH9_9PSEU|nr:amino acid ABC transporter permease [Crossiella equi]MBP2473691.1 glutamate transport system permease protein [Crossiella equi]
MLDFLSEYDVLGAFWITVQLTVFSAIGSLIWGTVLAGMRVSPVPIMRAFGTFYVNVVRNTPLTLVILAMSLALYNVLGVKLYAEVPGDLTFTDTNNFRLAVLGFVIYTSTFVCESIRAGINTVPVGQAEAARALGLGFGQTLGRIVLPQAFRAVVAPLASVLIALTKNTTVASAIGVVEAATLMSGMIEKESDNIILVFTTVALGFVVLTLPTGLFLGWVSKKVAVKR